MDRRGHQTFRNNRFKPSEREEAELRGAVVAPQQKDDEAQHQSPAHMTTPLAKRTRGLEDPFYSENARTSKSPRKDDQGTGQGSALKPFRPLSLPNRESPNPQTPGGLSTISKQTATTEANLLTEDILSVLTKYEVSLPEEVHDEIKSVAAKFAMKMYGVVKGRDFARTELQKKNVELQKLSGKNRELETSLEMHKVSSDLLIRRAKELQEHMAAEKEQ